MADADEDKGKVDTLRPEANSDGADMYSSATVVRDLPPDLAAMMKAAAEKAIADDAPSPSSVRSSSAPASGRSSSAPASARSPTGPPALPRPASKLPPRPHRATPVPEERTILPPPDSAPGSVPSRAPRPNARAVARPPSPWQKLVPVSGAPSKGDAAPVSQRANDPHADAGPTVVAPRVVTPPPFPAVKSPGVSTFVSPDLSLANDASQPEVATVIASTPMGRASEGESLRASVFDRATAVPSGRDSSGGLDAAKIRSSVHERPTAVPGEQDEALPTTDSGPDAVADPQALVAANSHGDERVVTPLSEADDEAMMRAMGGRHSPLLRVALVVLIGIAIGLLAIWAIR